MFRRATGFTWAIAAALIVVGPLLLWGLAQSLGDVSLASLDRARALGCVLVLFGLVAARWVFVHRARWGSVAVALFGVLALALALTTVDSTLRERLGTPRHVSSWNFFHYYLGSKYFAELGYDGLYEEALKADEQGRQRFTQVKRYRDMKTYDTRPAAKVRTLPPRELWTEARWAEFVRDVATIGGLESRGFWVHPLQDRGYNPPPGWTLLGGTLAKLTDPRNPLQSGFLMCVDPGLLLLAFWLSARTYGLFRSLVALLGMVLWVGSYRLFGGKLVQYDWLAALWASLCCMRREQWLWAGALAAYATSVRVFPGGLMLGAFAGAVFEAYRGRRLSGPLVQLFGGGAAVLLALVLLSSVTSGRGLSAWSEFVEKSSVHQFEHKFNETRIGLPYLSTSSVETGFGNDVRRSVREANYEDNRGARWLVQGLLVVLVLLAARRSDLHDAALLGLVLVFAFAVSSRYYGALYGLLLLRGAVAIPRAPPGERFTVSLRRAFTSAAGWRVSWLDLGFFLVLAVSYVQVMLGADTRPLYMASNVALLTYLLVMLVGQVRGGRVDARAKHTDRSTGTSANASGAPA